MEVSTPRETYYHITLRVLVIVFLAMTSTCAFARIASDKEEKDTIRGNIYMKFNLDVKRRNVFLQAVPDLYNIAKGQRFHVGESYGKYTYVEDTGDFDYNEQLRVSTIRKQRMVLGTQLQYVTPKIYNEEIFSDFILSPFHAKNRWLYRYETNQFGDYQLVKFHPRVRNSVLTSGIAVIDSRTSKVLEANLYGEFDQISYLVDIAMDSVKNVPVTCDLHSSFKFFGNRITSNLFARYNNDESLPDTITNKNSMRLIESIRKDSLTDSEKEAYYDKYYKVEEVVIDTTPKEPRKHSFLDRMWSGISHYLIGSIRYSSSNMYMKLYPILDPLAISYSQRKGVSYRFRFRSSWDFTDNSYLSFNPRFGYNFKQKQVFINAPLRYVYDTKRKGYAELYVSNGNRISNAIIYQKTKEAAERDSIDIENLELQYYNKREISLNSNIPIGRHFHIGLAAVYYHRNAVNKQKLTEMGQKSEYTTFAPSLTLKYQPSSYVAYVLNYERSIPKFLGCDSKYERMEADAQFAVRYNALTSLNIRVGGGMYTDMSSNYFVDYNNFAENYLPEAWDEWSGQFFLIRSDLYNASKYYLRANLSYESPILPLAYLPFVGYYIEKERIYASVVQLQKSRPYYELGYAFTTRFASFGLFASSFGTHFKELGTKITFELFKRW